MRGRARSWLGALALVGATACESPRPTEFVNITFTPSVDTDHYRTWDFNLESCLDLTDPRYDDGFLRAQLLAAIEAELERLGYTHRTDGPVDFTVSYELAIAEGGDLPDARERIRGRIFVRDVATGRFVWRGERKAPFAGRAVPQEQQAEVIRHFVHELLQYTRKLRPPEEPT